MDILVSSNLERLIYLIAGCDANKTELLMKALKEEGVYSIDNEMKSKLSDFDSGYATEDMIANSIKAVYSQARYVMDTHTAVADVVCKEYKAKNNDEKKCVIASTASPYKFVESVMGAIDEKYNGVEAFELVDELNQVSGVEIPNAIEEIREANILHTLECDADKMKDIVKTILKIEE